MKYDLTKLIDRTREELEENNKRNNDENRIPIVYPGENGKLTVRILYNPKMEAVQRKIVRHDGGKSKVPCLEVYGEDCMVCKAISEVENAKGKEAGAFRKYGFKTRGICYAIIVDHDKSYFKDDGSPEIGDIVLLMYPKTVYDQITKIISDAGEHLSKIVLENDGLPIVIERSQKGKAFPEYSATVYPYGSKKTFQDDGDDVPKDQFKTGDEKFEDMLAELPDLREAIVSSNPSDDIRKANRALAETITQEYFGGGLVNPGDKVEEPEQDERLSTTNMAQEAPVQSSQNDEQVDTSGRPDCYGNHSDSNKCLMCPHEPDCYMSNPDK